ncbi:MAG: metallophosphoesterase, partial [Rhodothermales bacterium]
MILIATPACAPSALVRLSTDLLGGDGLPPDSTLAYALILVGDGGDAPRGQTEPSFMLLDRMLDERGDRSTVVFLGDNIYPSGMPPNSSPERQDAERRINAQLEVVADHEGGVVFVPGNHDWGGIGLGGNRPALRRQEVYVENYLDRGNVFLPDRGFPGPVALELTDDLALIVVDTQWWLEDYKPYGNTGTYQLEQEGEFLIELDDILWRYAGKHLVVVGHHPVFSNGEHGGRFRGLRSLFTGERLARGYLGTPQDMSNLKYRQLRDAFLAIFEHHRDLVYAAGHDHNLQYFKNQDQHYVISGSASKQGHVKPGYGSSFVSAASGFADLRYFTDGSIWLSFYEPEGDGTEGAVLFRERIREGSRPLVAVREDSDGAVIDPPVAALDTLDLVERGNGSAEVDTSSVEDDEGGKIGPATMRVGEPIPDQDPYSLASQGSISVQINPEYTVSGFKETFLGEGYRDVWALPVTLPIIDLSRTAGGLTVLQKGGGLQTVSLRFAGADGDEYVLRSVDKDPTASIPEYLRQTIAEDVVEDQIAAIHPFAQEILPPLARAVGVYHTHPTMVYVPDDPRLGIYRNIFAGMVAHFESRPDGEQSDEARFGFADNVIGSPKLFENIQEDNDERVDERAFLRARLFDMVIGDWDRHKDQWRWAEFDVTPGRT